MPAAWTEPDDLPSPEVEAAAEVYGLDPAVYQDLVDRGRHDILDDYLLARQLTVSMVEKRELRERREVILRLCANGQQQSTIARAVGVTPMTVHNAIYGTHQRRGKRQVRAEQ